jgi:hypothetical protein
MSAAPIPPPIPKIQRKPSSVARPSALCAASRAPTMAEAIDPPTWRSTPLAAIELPS